MIEYMVVLAFGVIILIKPFSFNDINDPNATPDQAPALQQVAKAIRDYHEHYTAALSIAYIPDCDYQYALDKSATVNDIATLTGGITVGFDRCIDWTNPAIPAVDIKTALSIDMATNLGDIIKNAITDSIKSSVAGFLDPSTVLDGLLHFDASSFFP